MPTISKLELVGQMMEHGMAGRFDKMAEYFTDSVIWCTNLPPEMPMGGMFTGPAGVIRFVRAHRETLQMEWDKTILATEKDDTVVIVGRERCIVKKTGAPYEADYCMVFMFAAEKIAHVYAFGDSHALARAYNR